MRKIQEEAIWREPRKEYEKTMKRVIKKKVGTITIVVTEDTYDKALTAFNIGVGGVQMGMKVYMFFTSRGVNILKKAYKPRRARWGEAPIGWKETFIKKRGGPILANLMYQAKDMGVHLYVCYTSMISMGLKEEMFISDIKAIRMAEFLELAMESDAQFVIG
ncbi:MAG: DsrE/DsrF/DrsH-like family protein [Thermoplasmatales archaeon]|nr:MAG: DsrE/DsrF/DrsH-like family protein [Thermoplasmatales archaeon]